MVRGEIEVLLYVGLLHRGRVTTGLPVSSRGTNRYTSFIERIYYYGGIGIHFAAANKKSAGLTANKAKEQ